MASPDRHIPAQDDLEPGQCIAGYTIEKKIGAGAMAVLYLVTDGDGNPYALKIPLQRYGIDPVSLVAFENELRLAPYLEDFPHACRPKVIHDGDHKYLLLEYIEGVDLWKHMTKNGCLSEDEAISLTKKIVHALSELHQRRIIHLDIKLSNIMVNAAGEIRLIDFGLANHLDLPDLIHESFYEPKGTPCYIAPEQFIGTRDDVRSDIFSLGVMLFEMTTNKLPFDEGYSAWDVISRIKKDFILPKKYNPNLSETFNFVVGSCLHSNPELRFAYMDDLYEMLGMWEGGIPVDSIMGYEKNTISPPRPSENPVSQLLNPAYRALRNLFDFTPDNYQRLKQWAEYRRKNQKEKRYRILVSIMLDQNMQLTTFSKEIIEEAYYLARLQNAVITIISAIECDSGLASEDAKAQQNNILCYKARIAISSLVQASSEAGLAVGINVMVGTPIEVIENCVNYYNADLLVIGARKKPTFHHFMRNNTGSRILTAIKCNTYVVHEGKGIFSRKPAQDNPGMQPDNPQQNVI